MRLRRRGAAAALAFAATFLIGAAAGCSSNSSDSSETRGPAPTEPTPTTTARPGTGANGIPTFPPHKTVLTARLSGRSVVPGPGALSGSGTATITLDPTAGQVCYQLTVASIDPPSSADIFTGPAGAIGPATVHLETPADGKAEGCVTAEQGIIESIRSNPAGFYVSVVNVQFPGGALRGQLSF